MSQLRSIESTILFEEKLRRRKETEDPFLKHLRSVLPRDGSWEVFK